MTPHSIFFPIILLIATNITVYNTYSIRWRPTASFTLALGFSDSIEALVKYTIISMCGACNLLVFVAWMPCAKNMSQLAKKNPVGGHVQPAYVLWEEVCILNLHLARYCPLSQSLRFSHVSNDNS